MKTLEEKIKSRKQSLLISTALMYIVAIVISFQFYRVYVTYPIFTINNIEEAIDIMSENMRNDFFFMPTKEYFKIAGMILLIAIGYLMIKTDEVSKRYMKDTAYGTSRWATDKEIKKLGEKKYNIILAENVKQSLNTRKTHLNNLVLVQGPSGSGKTRFVVKPQLMEIARTGCQRGVILMDPKGELVIETATMMKKYGYEVKIFDVKDFQGNSWNPFVYFKSEKDILSFVKSLIANTDDKEKKGGDAFWDSASILLFNSVIFYLMEFCSPSERNLINVKELIRLAQASEDNEKFKSKLDLLMEKAEQEKPKSKAVEFYKDFKKAAGKTLKSIIITCMARLNFIGIEEIDNMLMKDEFDLESVGDEKTVIYIIIPDDDTAFNFLSALFIDQLFSTLMRKADKMRKKNNIQIILEEQANIGKITNFAEKLSTVRSRNISIISIFQDIQQIESLYKGQEKVILQNFNTKLILGADESAEWVSKKLGKMTIDNRTSGKSKGKNSSSSINESQMARDLMTPDEVQRMDKNKCIIMTQGNYPILANKYDIAKHPFYKELGDVNEDNENNFDIKNLKRSVDDGRKISIDMPEINIQEGYAEKKSREEVMEALSNSLESELDGIVVEEDDVDDNLLNLFME